MYNLNDTLNKCKSILDDLNINYGIIRDISVNTRAKKRWGQCCRIYRGVFAISISATLLDENHPIEALETTILHELLHTVDGCMNHGDKWQVLANIVNKAYGYNIKRCTSMEEKGFSEEEQNSIYKYIITCNECHHTWRYTRMCKTVKICQCGTGVCSCGGRSFTVSSKE